MALPPSARPVFDPLELSDGPRSPRAPAPSEPIFIGEGEAEMTNPGPDVPPDLDAEVTRTKGK
jgi:hypothetical protein